VLILGRRAGEAVVINGDVRLVILACDRRGVRIGIDAPAQVSIVREEILHQVAAENKRGAALQSLAELAAATGIPLQAPASSTPGKPPGAKRAGLRRPESE
jgi:carbon storage regulator